MRISPGTKHFLRYMALALAGLVLLIYLERIPL